tara:strand:+ start:2397 stop:3446 length:1050 start_codon:yes stop_codon:yes gene_type:complete
MNIAEAKDRIRIPNVWAHFNLPGEPRASCKSPFRDEHKPSFSVSAAGDLWNDFGTGEGGDAVDFFQRASGLSRTEACKRFIALAGGSPTATAHAARPHPKPAEAKPRPVFPDFRKGTADEIKQLAGIRSIGLEGLELASERGLLHFAELKGSPAWIITDSEGVNAQARRMDGQPHPETGHGPNVYYDSQNVPHDRMPAQGWQHLEGKPKAWTLPGSWAAWPIGIKEAQPFKHIALCEGGPDLLAACHIIAGESREHDCAPVAMIGAKLRIPDDALPVFAGKRVRIFGHADEAGRAAVDTWARQLEPVGAVVDAFEFAGLVQLNGEPVNDLNDALMMNPDSFSEAESLLP